MSRERAGVRESFEKALIFALDNREALIVHGWIRKSPSTKQLYVPHAWNEKGEGVYDLIQHDRPISKELFYRKHNIRENRIRRYTVQEAACMAVGTTSYGPWDGELFDVETLTHEELITRFGK